MNISLECGGGFIQIIAFEKDLSACASIPTAVARELDLFSLVKEINHKIDSCITLLKERLA